MIYLFVLISFFAEAGSPRKWENAKSIVEKHEFYKNGETILKPQNSWQLLFALTFLDSNFKMTKDCVYYRVPGDEPGKIKVRAVPFEQECHSEILAPGDIELEQVSNLSIFTQDNAVKLVFQMNKKNESWSVATAADWKKPDPKLLLSSADYKSPGVIYLAPGTSPTKKPEGIKDGVLCHHIASDCQELTPSTCRNCEHGWQEIPNGCVIGPKVCGVSACGGKDQPACRRGIVWQRSEESYDCRSHTSFAWCAGKLSMTCDGDKAYCR
jgi:hypothetical protein